MDNNRPKRVRHKDNPYKIFTEQGKYYVSFKDGQGNSIVQEITKEIFDLFDEIELIDKSEMNEYSRHIEHSTQTEINLHQKTLSKTLSFEDIIYSKIRDAEIRKKLSCLPPLQRERVILFYWERVSCAEIAEIQGCSRQAVSLSIRRAREKLRKEIEKDRNNT